jgi:diguanylate cyclase (GGDEF)-like protein/PAS domain S-box-containing protein
MTYDYADLIDKMYDAVYFVDKDRRITYWNKAAETITGYSAEEVIESRCSDNILVHVDDEGKGLCEGDCPLAKTIEDGTSREAEVYLRHKEGHRVPVLVRTTPLTDENGLVVGAAELFTYMSSKSAMLLRIRELEDLALIDDLTKLANRRYVESELEARFAEKRRHGLPFGILFMDIDHFKRLNDTYGHAFGDLVLKTVASTLRSSARAFDLIGRWGGEEFVAIVRNADHDILVKVGERFRMLVEKSLVPIEDDVVGATISVGATVARKDDTTGSILKRADELMYMSKERGRNCLTAEPDQESGSDDQSGI